MIVDLFLKYYSSFCVYDGDDFMLVGNYWGVDLSEIELISIDNTREALLGLFLEEDIES